MSNLIRHVIRRLKTIGEFQWMSIVLLVATAFFIVSYFGKSEVWRTIRIEVVGRDWTTSYGTTLSPPFWLADAIHSGDVERSPSGGIEAEVVRVENSEDLEGEVLYLTVRLLTQFDKRSNTFVFKGKALEIGSPIELHLANTFIRGQIVDDDAPEEDYEQRWVTISGRVRGQESWYIAQVNPGDQMIDFGTGEVLAEILSSRAVPATTAVLHSTQDGLLVIQNSPAMRDILLTANIKVVRIGETWYFAGQQKVKIGEFIHIFLPELDVEWIWLEDVQGIPFDS